MGRAPSGKRRSQDAVSLIHVPVVEEEETGLSVRSLESTHRGLGEHENRGCPPEQPAKKVFGQMKSLLSRIRRKPNIVKVKVMSCGRRYAPRVRYSVVSEVSE